MKKEIVHEPLVDFIDHANKGNIDFAKITYTCGAHEFVEEFVNFDFSRNDGFIKTYDFKKFYKEKGNRQYHSYYVASILNKSYVMYEMKEDITIWVCFTEEKFRGNGFIEILLKFIIKNNQEKIITIHTYNEVLLKICRRLKIRIFQER